MKRDGEAFEKKVIAKKDERFSFLEPGDVYYNYYNWRKKAALVRASSWFVHCIILSVALLFVSASLICYA